MIKLNTINKENKMKPKIKKGSKVRMNYEWDNQITEIIGIEYDQENDTEIITANYTTEDGDSYERWAYLKQISRIIKY